ncbi:MAG: MaoC family dehydratase, partial [Deltaproteobacteria bacterium]|nr:MaoC family dehydratase [Deltaproteobacteria bacterium]
MGKKARHSIFINSILFLLLCSILILTISCKKAEEPEEEAQTPSNHQIQTATSGPAQAPESDFLTLYPGVYTEKEKAPVTEWMEVARAINERGTIDIKAMINGTLSEDTPGYVRSFKISETMVRYFNRLRDPENPLLNDSDYARKAGYRDIIGYPTLAAHDDSFMIAYPNSARDKLLVADLIHSVTNLKPVYPGDTLYWVIDSRHVKDLTPETGAEYRSNAIINNGSVYNQRG